MKSDNQLRTELGLPIPTPEQLEKRRKRELAAMRFGHAVGPDNILRPIAGAITGYDPETCKPVIGVPLKTREPQWKKLKPVSIDSLVEADGDIGEAEPDIVELGVRIEPAPIVAGVDDDDDPETQASEQAADSALLPEFGLDDAVEEEADSEQ
jgi:hypothetical protein